GLAGAITGVSHSAGGVVRVGERVLRRGDPRDAIESGIAHVPEDRLGTGVAPSLSIASNVVLKSYRSRDFSRGPVLLGRRVVKRANQLIKRYDIKAPAPTLPPRQLSGGNLQKVVLGREFTGSPRVLVAAAPTRGLDVGAIDTVHDYLLDAG